MAGKTRVIVLVLVLCLGINLDKAEANHHDACRRVLQHRDFHSPCGSLSDNIIHKRPCMVSTPADEQYLKKVKIKYLYRAPGVTGPMICAPRWNNTNNAECISAPLVADNSVDWTWSKWSLSGGQTISRRVTLTGYNTNVQCIYAESFKVLKDCAAAKNVGLPSGVTTIYPDKTTPMNVYCDQETDGGGWIVFQKRISYSDFYLDWVNYTAGFGDPSTNYWLGLENIHLLTSLSYTQMKVVVEYPAGTFASADHSLFMVGDSSTDYSLKVSGYSSTSTPPAGDSLNWYHNGMKFSTRDMDNDLYSQQCAVNYHGAWWYRSCYYSNLNGIYGARYPQAMYWHTLPSSPQSLFSSKMMVR